jgi:hypothetical protein
MNKRQIDALLSSGVSPKRIAEMSAADHRRQIQREISAGKWKCPHCFEPMKLREDCSALFCDRHDK